MVRGLETFSHYFKQFKDCYIIIGGVACESHFEEQRIPFRVTKDVDVILVVEAIDSRFIQAFWDFIKQGEYEQRQVGEGDRRYYRFIKPRQETYPLQLELFSKKPDIITLSPEMTLTPIPADEELSSLSAILMDNDYYEFTLAHTREVNGARIAESEALICLKAKAYLDLSNRKNAGESVDSKNIAKHRNDVFRLAAILSGEEAIALPATIRQDMYAFLAAMEEETPDVKPIFKAMGITSVDAKGLLQQVRETFTLF